MYDGARRVMEMVAELHKLRYERLRLAPAISPSGMYWRGNVTAVSNILRRHGAMILSYDKALVALHSTGEGAQVFGWADAEDSPQQLAQKFFERFASIAASGKGPDPAYSAWYQAMFS